MDLILKIWTFLQVGAAGENLIMQNTRAFSTHEFLQVCACARVCVPAGTCNKEGEKNPNPPYILNRVQNDALSEERVKKGLTGAREITHRPSKLEGDHNPASIVDFIRVIVGALKRKRISTDNLRRFSSERAGASGGHLHLIFLQAHFEVSVALVLSAAQVLGAPGTVAALPVRQLAVYILHGDQLQLEIAGWLGHLQPTYIHFF